MFFDKLKEACKEKGYSPSSLAGDLGLSKSNVTHWKSGKLPSRDTLFRIANKLDVSVEYLIDNEQKNSATTESDDAMRSEFIDILEMLTDEQAESLLQLARVLVKDKRDG